MNARRQVQVDSLSEDKMWFIHGFIPKGARDKKWFSEYVSTFSQHPSQIITGYLLSPRFSVVVETVVVGVVVGVVVVAVVVVVAMVVVGFVVVVGAVVVAGGGGGAVAGVGNRRCQKGKVGQG